MANTRNDRVSTLLKTLKTDVEDVARRSGKHPSSLYRIINGESEPTKSTLKALANATGANYNWLLTGDGEMMSPEGPKAPGAAGEAESYRDKLIAQLTDEKNRLAKEVERLWTIIAQQMLPPDKAANFKTPLRLSGSHARVLPLHTGAGEFVRAAVNE